VDGVPYEDAWGLAAVLRTHPAFTTCMTDTVFAYATGHRAALSEQDSVDWLDARFGEEGYSMQSLLRILVTSKAFTTPGEIGGAR